MSGSGRTGGRGRAPAAASLLRRITAPGACHTTFPEEESVEPVKKKRRRFVLPALAAGVALAVSGLITAGASSHREAPLISEDPVADNTDTYAFVSPDKPDSVTFVAN